MYKDTEGRTGHCYVHYKDIGIRIFFLDYKVCAFYLCKPQKADARINEKVKEIIPGKTIRQQVIETFGKPDKYVWGEETFSEENLPADDYIMVYNGVGVNFWVDGNTVREVRIESNEDYSYEGKISLGSNLEDVIAFFGEPSETVTGEPIGWQDKVLYKNIKGKTGYCYIYYKDIGVRIFFVDYRVRAVYLCIPGATL